MRKNWVDDAKRCAKSLYEHIGRKPTIEEMPDTYIELHMPHTQATIDQYPYMFACTADDHEKIKNDFLASKLVYYSFERLWD